MGETYAWPDEEELIKMVNLLVDGGQRSQPRVQRCSQGVGQGSETGAESGVAVLTIEVEERDLNLLQIWEDAWKKEGRRKRPLAGYLKALRPSEQ